MKKLLSVILLSYSSKEKINEVYESTKKTLKKENIDFEFIIMDDGSKDDSFKIAEKLELEEENVKAFQLSRNYTSNYSLFAGLSVCSGDCAVFIPDDGQPHPEIVTKMYHLWDNKHKIIFLNRSSRNDKWLTNVFANTFYKVMDYFADVKYPSGGTEIALIDREIIDILNNKIHHINTAIIPELLRLGFEPYHLEYDRLKGEHEKSRWTFKKKIKLAKDIFLSSSSFPIRFISFLGVFFSIFSLILIFFYGYTNIFGNSKFWGYTPPGWTSTVLFISFYSGLILFSLGIIAEYIWRIYEEVKDRPGFIIKKKESY